MLVGKRLLGLRRPSATILQSQCSGYKLESSPSTRPIRHVCTYSGSVHAGMRCNQELFNGAYAHHLTGRLQSTSAFDASALTNLVSLAENSQHQGSGKVDDELCNVCASILDSTRVIVPLVHMLAVHCGRYDPCPGVECNGLRSCLSLVLVLSEHLASSLEKCQTKGQTGRARTQALQKLKNGSKLMLCLSGLLGHVKTVVNQDSDNQLIVDRGKFPENFLDEAEKMDRAAFYGVLQGFQFDRELRPALAIIVAAQATMGQAYFRHHHPDGSKTGLRGMLPNARELINAVASRENVAKSFLEVTGRHDQKYAQAFWSLPEIFSTYGIERVVDGLTKCAVNTLMQIGPDVVKFTGEDLKCLGRKPSPTVSCNVQHPGEVITVPPPLDSNGMPATVTVRHMSMKDSTELSPALIVHFHGGGFIAQTSKSHQTYLTHWANKLDAPIISVDYSLAPEDPYPRAVNDCLYAYAWALKNSKQLGSTARRIIFVGDSAGGNFVFSVALLASQYRIPVPNLLLAAYPALFIELNPSPGRLQSVLDPLLPYGVLNACLLAYRGPDRRPCSPKLIKEFPPLTAEIHRKHSEILDSSDAFLSPALAPDDMLAALPEVHLMPCAFDPLVDDSIVMARRLHKLNKSVSVHPMTDLCHGFLNFFTVSHRARQASEKCVEIMKSVIDKE